MSILHGSFIKRKKHSYFFIWSEKWKQLDNLKFDLEAEYLYEYPFLVRQPQSLETILEEYNLTFTDKKEELDLTQIWQEELVLLPSQKKPKSKTVVPLLYEQFIEIDNKLSSVILYPWVIDGLKLNFQQTLKFLQKLPLNKVDYIAVDLRFWSHIYRWSLSLICRHKFLPSLDEQNNCFWQPILDSNIDQSRLTKFVQLMPSMCRCYLEAEEDSPVDQQELILNFLINILDAQLKQLIDVPVTTNSEVTVQPWLECLSQENNSKCELLPLDSKRLTTALDNWTLPIQDYLITADYQLLNKQYRNCFKLQPPTNKDRQDNYDNWKLDYYLQAIDNPEFLVPTEQIWRHSQPELKIDDRLIDKPQETILKGLGLAAKFYEPISQSLNNPMPNYCELNAIEAYQFIRSVAWQLQDNGLGVILPKGLGEGTEEKRLGVKIEAKVDLNKGERLSLNSLLNYNLKVAVGDKNLTQKEFQHLLAQKSPIVEIDGEWLALQPADVKAAQDIFNQADNNINLTVEDALRLSSIKGETIAKLPVIAFESSGALADLINSVNDNQKINILPPPQQFKGTLREYQKVGFSWLYFLEKWNLGACLADDMGLGKTVQLIAFLLTLKEQNLLNNLPTLIVCPTSVLNNWEREIAKFASNLKVIIHHGDSRSKDKSFVKEAKKQDVIITSYALIFRDFDTLNQVTWRGIVLDEAQNIKNPQAKQTQAVQQLKAGFRIALTGTPVENRLSELWSILEFLNPGYLGTKQFFQRRFTIPIEKYGDQDSLRILRALVQPFILRRLKTDKNIIQDLPEKQEMNVYCGLSSEQAQLYQDLVNQSLEKINESSGIKRHGLVLNLLMKLKQICNHPAHFLKEKTLNIEPRSGKLLRLEEMLDEVVAEGDRSLIFTQFAEWGNLLQPYLKQKLGVEVLFLSGSTKREKRQEMVDRFQNDPQGPPIFILSLKAGGTGLNLTKANHVFHYDRWWNPAVENQATDRAFRIGQKQNVQVHKFICSGTLEEKINDILENKKQLADQTINTGEEWLSDLDTDQLRNLLILERNAVL